jgi:hypothetical protein
MTCESGALPQKSQECIYSGTKEYWYHFQYILYYVVCITINLVLNILYKSMRYLQVERLTSNANFAKSPETVVLNFYGVQESIPPAIGTANQNPTLFLAHIDCPKIPVLNSIPASFNPPGIGDEGG